MQLVCRGSTDAVRSDKRLVLFGSGLLDGKHPAPRAMLVLYFYGLHPLCSTAAGGGACFVHAACGLLVTYAIAMLTLTASAICMVAVSTASSTPRAWLRKIRSPLWVVTAAAAAAAPPFDSCSAHQRQQRLLVAVGCVKWRSSVHAHSVHCTQVWGQSCELHDPPVDMLGRGWTLHVRRSITSGGPDM